jgi:hypothetical protein
MKFLGHRINHGWALADKPEDRVPPAGVAGITWHNLAWAGKNEWVIWTKMWSHGEGLLGIIEYMKWEKVQHQLHH